MIGVLNMDFDVINTTIRFRTQNIVSFNYVYIENLKRYYFVTGVKQDGDVCKVSLRLDVLQTYKNDIVKMSGIVKKGNDDLYNSGRATPYIKKPRYEHLSFDGDAFDETGSLIMITLRGKNE